MPLGKSTSKDNDPCLSNIEALSLIVNETFELSGHASDFGF